MSVQTMLLDFTLDAARVCDRAGQEVIFLLLEEVLKEYMEELRMVADVVVENGRIKLLVASCGTSVSIRMFDRGLVTINIEYLKEENEDQLINFKSVRAMENSIRKYLSTTKSQALPPVKRCVFSRYFPSSDERLLEYDIDAVVFDEQSQFQRVQVVHSKSMGNMLVLDYLQNISEVDLIYTETLMQRGTEIYEGKEIIILGGGDGALLYELLKEKPKFVWMLEIDDTVMKACKKHLRSICGTVLDEMKTNNYEIIVQDCMLTMNKFIADGKKVDYIFGDLTDIPISDEPCGELWEFMITILDTSFKILKSTGKFMTHGSGATSPELLEMYEKELGKLKPPVKFTKAKAFVPSFLEDWVFYQISSKCTKNGKA